MLRKCMGCRLSGWTWTLIRMGGHSIRLVQEQPPGKDSDVIVRVTSIDPDVTANRSNSVLQPTLVLPPCPDN